MNKYIKNKKPDKPGKNAKNGKNGKKGGDMVSDAFNASATFGRIMSWFGLVIGIIFSIIIIVIGVVFVNSKTYDSSIDAKITSTSCSGSGKDASCTLELSYQVNETEYKTNTSVNKIYNVGQIIPIKYDSANPVDITTTTVSPKLIGGICIGFGLLLLIGVCAWTYIVQTNDTVAAVSGVGNMVGMVNNSVDVTPE